MSIDLPGRRTRYTSALAICFTALVGLAAIYLWRLMPIYPDEIGFRILTARALFDGFDHISLTQLCESTASLPIPWVFYPAALAFSLYSLVENMVHYRAIALAFITVSFIVLAYSLRILAATQRARGGAIAVDPDTRILLFCSLLLLCTIGVMPAAYAIVRPENIIILTICLVVLSLAIDPSDRGPLRFLVSGAILLLYTMALYVHPKSLYLVPAIALALVRLFLGQSRIAIVGSLAVLAWTLFSGYRMHTLQFLTCPEVESIEQASSMDNIAPLTLFSRPLSFLNQLIDNNLSFEPWRRFFSQPLFKNSYDVSYLPGVELAGWTLPITNGLIVLCVGAVLALAAVFLWRHARATWRAPASLRAGGSPDARNASVDYASGQYELSPAVRRHLHSSGAQSITELVRYSVLDARLFHSRRGFGGEVVARRRRGCGAAATSCCLLRRRCADGHPFCLSVVLDDLSRPEKGICRPEHCCSQLRL